METSGDVDKVEHPSLVVVVVVVDRSPPSSVGKQVWLASRLGRRSQTELSAGERREAKQRVFVQDGGAGILRWFCVHSPASERASWLTDETGGKSRLAYRVVQCGARADTSVWRGRPAIVVGVVVSIGVYFLLARTEEMMIGVAK